MFVLRTPREMQYNPVRVDAIKTSNPFGLEIKKTIPIRKTKVSVEANL